MRGSTSAVTTVDDLLESLCESARRSAETCREIWESGLELLVTDMMPIYEIYAESLGKSVAELSREEKTQAFMNYTIAKYEQGEACDSMK